MASLTDSCDERGAAVESIPPIEHLVGPPRRSPAEHRVVQAEPLPGSCPGHLELIELMLKNQPLLDRVIREPRWRAELVPRLLEIAFCGLTLFGIALVVILAMTGIELTPHPVATVLREPGTPIVEMTVHHGGTERRPPFTSIGDWRLVIAYTFGPIAATGICLPSLYFYGLLSGLRLPLLDVVLHALKAKATSAVALVGGLPIYVAVALSPALLGTREDVLILIVLVGLTFPFFAGLVGTWSLYRGFYALRHTMPAEQCQSRQCMIRRLVAAWCAVYTAVAPLMVFTIGCFLESAG